MSVQHEYSFYDSLQVEGERILWTGKPGKGNLITWETWDVFLFGIIWSAVCALLLIISIRNGYIWPVPILALFSLPGLYLCCVHYCLQAHARKYTRYIITDRRIIRWQKGQILVMPKGYLPAMRLVYYKNGNGSIRFTSANRKWFHFPHSRVLFLDDTFFQSGFFDLENIPNISQAQKAIEEMKKVGMS